MSRNAQNDHLTRLEQTSIHVFREAFANFRSVCMPWSMGKDSNVLIWLARKAFCGKIPFPLLHIDTTYEFPEMYEFREKAKAIHGIDLIVRVNEDAIRRGIGYATHDPVTVTHELKTVPFKAAIDEFKWDALVTGIRRDEDPTRAKERWFSPRSAEGNWDYKDQPPEFWGQFASVAPEGGHVRSSPSSNGRNSIFGNISAARISRTRRFTSPAMVSASARSVATRSRTRSTALLAISTKSSRNSNSPRSANAPVAPRTTSVVTPCKNSGPRGSCKSSSRTATPRQTPPNHEHLFPS